MFNLPTTIEERIDQVLAGRVCTAPDGSYMTRSNGRRKAGRPMRYFVHRADGTSFTLTADHDEQAVERANKRIDKGVTDERE